MNIKQAEMENFISEKIKEDLKNLTRKKDSEAKLAFFFKRPCKFTI